MQGLYDKALKIFTAVYHSSHSLNERRSALPLVPKVSRKVSFSHFIHNTSKLTAYETELGQLIVAVGMFFDILFPQQFERYVRTFHLVLKVRKQFLEYLKSLIRISWRASFQTMLQHWVVQGQQPVNTKVVCVGLLYIAVDSLLVDAEEFCRLSV